jgi:metal-responsive CopG/Arc/MetJ family transcriptional regulator
MAKDVHQVLIDIIVANTGKSVDDANKYLAELQKQKRYQTGIPLHLSLSSNCCRCMVLNGKKFSIKVNSQKKSLRAMML